MLKKIFLGILALIVLILVFHSFIIGVLAKPQVEQQLSKILGTDVKINVLSVRLWPGNAAVYGLKIKNPAGFSDDNLLDLGSAAVSLDIPGLAKQFTSGSPEPKTVVIEHIKIKGLKFLFERLNQEPKPLSNVEQLVENLNASQSVAEPEDETQAEKKEETKAADIRVELKNFSFEDGMVTVRDSTIGKGFEYTVSDINIEVNNIFFPAKPASELVETIDFSAKLGKENPGTLRFTGKSNFMAGANLDSDLVIEGVSLADFNAFVADQPFEMTAGGFDLNSKIKIENDELASTHQMKLNSLELAGKKDGNKLIGLPLQTVISAVSRLPSLDVPFEVNGNLSNPQFKVTQAIRMAISAAVQKVLAAGLGDLKGLATDLKGQALGVAGGSAEMVTEDAKKIVQGIAGEGTEQIDAGLKKLSGLLGKVKSE